MRVNEVVDVLELNRILGQTDGNTPETIAALIEWRDGTQQSVDVNVTSPPPDSQAVARDIDRQVRTKGQRVTAKPEPSNEVAVADNAERDF